jgi:hypothetical protein
MLFKEEEDEQENFNELPRFGQPSVTASESQYKYGSTVKEIVNPYEIVPWSVQVQENFRNHCSVFIWLLSVLSVTTVTTRVSDDQRKLEIFTILPTILDKDRVDERNARCFRDSSGQPLYPPSHIRSVSHKQALSTYARNEKGQVVFKQTIYLPFRVGKEPCKMWGKAGVQIYFFGQQGEIKIMVVELVSASSQHLSTKNYVPSRYDLFSVAGTGQHTMLGGGSFHSIDPATGQPRPRVAGLPRTIDTDGSYRTHNVRGSNVSYQSVETRCSTSHRSYPSQRMVGIDRSVRSTVARLPDWNINQDLS